MQNPYKREIIPRYMHYGTALMGVSSQNITHRLVFGSYRKIIYIQQ